MKSYNMQHLHLHILPVRLTTWVLILISTFLSLSHAFPISPQQIEGLNEGYNVTFIRMERLLQEGNNNEDANNKNSSTLILAAKRTYRPDPFNHFNYYTGGWDYTSVHYLASVVFSAAPLFIISAVWFSLLGLLFCISCLYCCCRCCCCCRNDKKKKSYEYVELTYALSLTLLITFTIVAISGCIVVFVNEPNFNTSVIDTLEFIVEKGLSVFESLISVLKALASAKTVVVNEISLPDEIKENIDIVDQMVNATANVPQIQSLAMKTAIQTALGPASFYVLFVAALMLVLALLGLCFALLGWRPFIFILVILGWILVTATFLSSGVYLIFRNLVADTCVAMEDWVQNPKSNSALSLQFLPCLNNTITQDALSITKQTTSSLVNISNQYITDFANKDLDPNDLLYYGQAGPFVPILCNPFNSDLTERNCTSDEVDFSNASEEWKKHVCEVSSAGKCTTVGRLTPKMYDQLTASVNISYSLNTSGSTLAELVDCNFVLNTFTKISKSHCPYLRRYSYRTYVGLVMISVSIMFSVILWMSHAKEKRHLKHTRKNAPKSAEVEMSGGYVKFRGESEEKPLGQW